MKDLNETRKNEFLDARQVSSIYFKNHISYKAVLKLCKEGKLPCLRIGRRYKFRAADLDEWCDRNFKTPTWRAIS